MGHAERPHELEKVGEDPLNVLKVTVVGALGSVQNVGTVASGASQC